MRQRQYGVREQVLGLCDHGAPRRTRSKQLLPFIPTRFFRLTRLSVIDPREAYAAAYQLAAGSGKGRSARDGSLRQSLAWRTMVLSTGEVRITDKLAESRQRVRAGQQVRLVDVPADADKAIGAFNHAGADGDAKVLADAIKSSPHQLWNGGAGIRAAPD